MLLWPAMGVRASYYPPFVGAVLDRLKSRIDGRTRLLVGHSLGGQAALLYVALDGGEQVRSSAPVAARVAAFAAKLPARWHPKEPPGGASGAVRRRVPRHSRRTRSVAVVRLWAS
ncbi:hypothetical protein [Plantactinospora alkalitolerans]|uniref:hypothetical protein n=1 Tax=Plantactinospora alkalitolerans TaxID=2789879 RepID=UPI00389AAC8C